MRMPEQWLRSALRQLRRRIDQYNSARRAQAQRRAPTTTSTGAFTVCSSTAIDNNRAPSVRPMKRWKKPRSPRSVTSPRKLCLHSAVNRDIGCGWGGLALTLARDPRRPGDGHHPIHRAAERSTRVRRPRALPTACPSLDYRRSIAHSTASDVRACSARRTTAPTAKHGGAVPEFRRRGAVARDRPLGFTNPWIAKYIFPGRSLPGAVRSPAANREDGSSPPTSRHRAYTTPRRCATGAAASPPTATPIASRTYERFSRRTSSSFYLLARTRRRSHGCSRPTRNSRPRGLRARHVIRRLSSAHFGTHPRYPRHPVCVRSCARYPVRDSHTHRFTCCSGSP